MIAEITKAVVEARMTTARVRVVESGGVEREEGSSGRHEDIGYALDARHAKAFAPDAYEAAMEAGYSKTERLTRLGESTHEDYPVWVVWRAGRDQNVFFGDVSVLR